MNSVHAFLPLGRKRKTSSSVFLDLLNLSSFISRGMTGISWTTTREQAHGVLAQSLSAYRTGFKQGRKCNRCCVKLWEQQLPPRYYYGINAPISLHVVCPPAPKIVSNKRSASHTILVENVTFYSLKCWSWSFLTLLEPFWEKISMR